MSVTLEGKEAEIAESVRAVGQQKTADKFGISRSTLRDFLYKKGLPTKKDDIAAREALNDIVAVDDPIRVENEKLKQKNKVLLKENNEYAKIFASRESFVDEVLEAIDVEVEKPDYEINHFDREEKYGTESVILPIFDQQYGQNVVPEDTPSGRGEYNTEIFDERLERYVDAATGIMARRYEGGYNIEELIFNLGGDQVEGDEIFAGQAWQLQITPPEQVWELSEKMKYAISDIIEFAKTELGTKRIAIYGVDDNHGKVGGKKSGARPAAYSWNWLFQKILFEKLGGQPIDEIACDPGGSLFYYCQGHEFQLIHGHQIKGWGGIPYYGISKFESKSVRLHNIAYRYLIMGHIHQPAEISNGAAETIVSPDWVGPNNLSGQIVAGSRPGQKVIFVSEKWGISGTERIYFETADKAFAKTPIYGVDPYA